MSIEMKIKIKTKCNTTKQKIIKSYLQHSCSLLLK